LIEILSTATSFFFFSSSDWAHNFGIKVNFVSVGFSLENYYFCRVRRASVTTSSSTYIIVVTSIATVHKDAKRLSCSRHCTMPISIWSKSLPAATTNVKGIQSKRQMNY
jgi:hypothetical protein